MFYVLKRIIITTLTLAFLWCAGLVWFVCEIPRAPVKDDAKTDAIVVLTGGSMRLEHGISLLIDNKAPILFVSGVEEGTPLSTLLRNKEVAALASRTPQERIVLGYRARSTLQNAEETKEWASKSNIKSIRLVTGNYHMIRSAYLLHRAMPDMKIIPDPVFPADFENNTWWLSESSVRLVLSEYHKYMASAFAYMLGILSEE